MTSDPGLYRYFEKDGRIVTMHTAYRNTVLVSAEFLAALFREAGYVEKTKEEAWPNG